MGKDEFVTWEDIVQYQNHGMEMSERNRDAALRKGYSEGDLCAFCSKPLKPGYKVIRVYIDNKDRIGEYYYNSSLTGGEELRCGDTCFKALQQAHDAKYGS